MNSNQDKTEQLIELAEECLDEVQGGALLIKFDGIDGESTKKDHDKGWWFI